MPSLAPSLKVLTSLAPLPFASLDGNTTDVSTLSTVWHSGGIQAKAAMERGLEHEREAVRRDADARLAAMQARVDRAEALAAHEAALRADMEQRLKFAFMRHVAGLNLEVCCVYMCTILHLQSLRSKSC